MSDDAPVTDAAEDGDVLGPGERFMSTKEVAVLFGVTIETVGNWVKRGHIDAKKVDGYWRLYRSSVIAFANQKYNS